MPDNEKGGWPLCPVCGSEMVIAGDRLICPELVNGIVLDRHREIPPLEVNVSDKAGVAGKIG